LKDIKMAQSPKPAAQKPEDPTVPTKSNKKIIMIAAGVLVLIIVAAAGWYFTKSKNDDHHAEEVKVEPPKTPIFVALEPFTVNLQRESADQYLQIGISMKTFDAEVETKIKANLPDIRSKILQLLTTKTATELLTAEGKKRLVSEILYSANASIGIVDAPAQTAVLLKAANAPAASHVSEAGTEAQQVHAAEAPAEPAPVQHSDPAKPVEKKRIVDVLFTSFIIQ
jgi:flagellar protein FliL